MLAGVAARPRPGMDKGVVRKARGKDHRGIVIGRKSQQLTRAEGPPFPLQLNLAEKDLLPIEDIFQLVEIFRDFPPLHKLFPQPAVYHPTEDIGRPVHRLAVSFNTLDQLLEKQVVHGSGVFHPFMI